MRTKHAQFTAQYLKFLGKDLAKRENILPKSSRRIKISAETLGSLGELKLRHQKYQ